MADDEDQSSKTEEPTDRKLNKLREEGNVPKSKEVGNMFMLFGMLLMVAFILPWELEQMRDLMAGMFQLAGSSRIEGPTDMASVLMLIFEKVLLTLAPLLGALFVMAYLSGFIQSGPLFSIKPVEPKLEKISILKGFKRLFSLKSLAEFLKSVVKLVVIGAIIWGVFFAYQDEFLLLPDTSLMAIATLTYEVAIWMLIAVLAVMLLMAIADFLFQKAEYTKENMMSRKELKDEVKETAGDPQIKQRQRQIQMQAAQQRMMQAVPDADVVITNPTHFAVALSYKPDEGMAAPKIVAKGADFIAQQIRDIAQRNHVPLYEDPPLARQLYDNGELGEEIPFDLYEVTAKVISHIMQLQKKRA